MTVWINILKNVKLKHKKMEKVRNNFIIGKSYNDIDGHILKITKINGVWVYYECETKKSGLLDSNGRYFSANSVYGDELIRLTK